MEGAGRGSISPWVLALAACMLRLQREAAEEAPAASADGHSDTESGEVTSRAARGPHGKSGRTAAPEFVVPAHASVEHIYWLEMARARTMRGRPIMSGDGDHSDGDSNVSGNSGDGSDRTRVDGGRYGDNGSPRGRRAHPGQGLLPRSDSVGAAAYGRSEQQARKEGPLGREQGILQGSGERASAPKPGATWTRSGGRAWVKKEASSAAASRRGGRVAEGAVGRGADGRGPAGIEGDVWEALLLAKEAATVSRWSGYERGAWARRRLMRHGASVAAPGSQCGLPLPALYSHRSM